MEIITYLIDLFLHLDEHLAAIISDYGTWTYALLFLIVFIKPVSRSARRENAPPPLPGTAGNRRWFPPPLHPVYQDACHQRKNSISIYIFCFFYIY